MVLAIASGLREAGQNDSDCCCARFAGGCLGRWSCEACRAWGLYALRQVAKLATVLGSGRHVLTFI